MSEAPTRAEIQKVREWECANTGHTYSDITKFGVDGPVAIVCDRCGKKWSVVHDG